MFDPQKRGYAKSPLFKGGLGVFNINSTVNTFELTDRRLYPKYGVKLGFDSG